VKNVIDALADLAAEELSKGEDFTLPGVVKLKWAYTAPRKKGEQYKKGDTYNSFGTEKTAEQDSPARKQSIRLKPYLPTGPAKIGKDDGVGRKAIAKKKKK
jgi:hypothetical protein